MSRSQSSLGLFEGAKEEQGKPVIDRGKSPAAAPQSSISGPVNLSGLVCNVRRTTGREPRALVGATTTILGDKLYVFGGRVLSRTRPQLTSDLYELDLIRRHWTKLETTGDVPPPRYFHSVSPLGDTKLVCYGGMSPAVPTRDPPPSTGSQGSPDAQPEVVVMSDIHIYDVPSRTWTRVPTKDSPQGRYAHCATVLPSSAHFTSADAPLSAIHNNPSSSNPHSGTIGVEIDGYGGAELVVVGGQDSSNHYIEQISVFNLRSLKWTSTTPLGRSCGAYRSVVVPLTGVDVSEIGKSAEDAAKGEAAQPKQNGSAMLIYSNYNFLDVKIELQIRLPDGSLVEKSMSAQASPPGLRFPNGAMINGHFVVSGTYLTSSKQEYALWALDLRTLTWGRIDAGGSVFAQGSWNRGVLWDRRSTFVILGHRKRSLVEDYNHRRINFSHICLVELEAFGLYNNPLRTAPTSGYVSVSSPAVPASLQPKLSQLISGGRPSTYASDELGAAAVSMPELSDMELQTLGGERIPVNSRILARRWGPFFIQLLRESADIGPSDSATLRAPAQSMPSRNSSVTITPSIGGASNYSSATTLVSHGSNSKLFSNLELPAAHVVPPSTRSRVLYLPHTYDTVRLLVYYLYTSSLPPSTSPLCTPQILCSILQLARPYQIDGLLEATVERLHQVLDGRNAAAVFNAAAMAAGGGRGTGFISGSGGTLEILNGVQNVNEAGESGPPPSTQQSMLTSDSSDTEPGIFGQQSRVDSMASRTIPLRVNTSFTSSNGIRNGDHDDAGSEASTTTSVSTNSFGKNESETPDEGSNRRNRSGTDPDIDRNVWTGDISSVIGLQKRGLRGLMEGRRLRERGGGGGSGSNPTGIVAGTGSAGAAAGPSSVGLGFGDLQT